MKRIKNSFLLLGIIALTLTSVFVFGKPAQASTIQVSAQAVSAKCGQTVQLKLPNNFIITKDGIFRTAKLRADYVRKNKFSYGDARKNPAFDDSEKLISCDRYVQWVLYDLGFKDLPVNSGLFVYSTNPEHDFATWCKQHGFVKITDINKVTAGDIIFLKNSKTGKADHVFILGESQGNGLWQRYDCGSQSRIQTVQPFSYEPVEYDTHPFTFAYRMLSPKTTWTSSNSKVAVVDSAGKITALTSGTCLITAVTGARSASYTLTVTKSKPNVASERELSKSYSGMAIIAGKNYLVKNGRKYTGYYTLNGRKYLVKNGRKYTGFRVSAKKTYYYSKGLPIKGLKTIKGKIYYFNSKGIMQTGWKTIGNKKYYFNSRGAAQTGLKKINGNYYCFSSKGVLYRSVGKVIRGKQYYFRANGRAAKGWTKIRGNYYYFSKKNCVMKKSTWIGKWYVNSKGIRTKHKK